PSGLRFCAKPARLKPRPTRAGKRRGGGRGKRAGLIHVSPRAPQKRKGLKSRPPPSPRPWQHVLEPLGAYLHLGRRLGGPQGGDYCKSWNFGPNNSANKTVGEVVGDVLRLWGSGEMKTAPDPAAPHEDDWLQVNCDRADHY